MNLILAMILLPLGAGVVCLLLKRLPSLCRALSLAVAAAVFVLSVMLFRGGRGIFTGWGVSLFRVDGLSALICLGIGFFGIVVGLYSAGFFGAWKKNGLYYGFSLMTLGAAVAAALADNYVLLISGWGFLGVALYVLVNLGGGGAAGAAKKTMIIVGGSDAFMLLGIAIIFLARSGGSSFYALGMSADPIPFTGGAAIAAYLCLAAGAFAKAGAMPLHSWVPDCAEKAPVPVTAFLPASLDKLLGIYLLVRISLHIFIMDGRMQALLMVVGAVTIVAAVMMAMVQHDLKKLLGYHAVSQVGYMVLGIGTGIPVGIAGGLFHMVNNCIYKTCLFLGGGAVEKRAGTADLDRLGGLARAMPVTFACFLVASLAISGIPPLNGFASKWMVYQGIIEMGKNGGALWVVWLLAAMFGSALTLASFVKLLHAIFLGRRSGALARREGRVREVGFGMWAPMAVLAALCFVFGIAAVPLAIGKFIMPAVGGSLEMIGLWNPVLATGLVIAGIAVGLIIYWASRGSSARETEPFVGGETLDAEMAVSGVNFYATIKEMGGLRWFYRKAGEKGFDIYDQGRNLTFRVTELLREAHGGLLPVYLGWCIVGMLVLLFILIK